MEQYRKDPNLEHKLTEGELDKYAAEQKQKFKEKNPVHQYKNKKRWKGRQIQRQQKLNQLAKQESIVDKYNRKDKLLNKLDHDQKQARLQQQTESKTHAEIQTEQRQKQLNQELAKDKAQAQKQQIAKAKEYGRNSRQTRSNRRQTRLSNKYNLLYKTVNVGSLAAFFASDVITRTMQKNINKAADSRNKTGP